MPALKIKKTFSVEKSTYLALEALSSVKGYSMSSLLDKIVKKTIEEEVKINPFLKLEMIELDYVDKEEQKEIEAILSSLSEEDLTPVAEVVFDLKTGEYSTIKI